MNISSISTEIGLTLNRAAAKTIPARSSSENSEHPPAEAIGLGQNNPPDTENAPQPVVNGAELSLDFSVDKETHTQVIKVIDRKSGDVIRQIPPEEVLNFLRQFQKSKGLFFSRRI